MQKEIAELLETIVSDLTAAFDVTTPPMPVEIMLQRPKVGMWKEVNLSELSTAFINVKHRYSPRMSIARLLARHICRSEWGVTRELAPLVDNSAAIHAFARAMLMPRAMLEALNDSNPTLLALSTRFEVPEEDVRLRLIDLGYPVNS